MSNTKSEVTVRDLEEGDEILWGDRKESLTVQGHDVHIDSAADLDGVSVESKRGTTYVIHEAMYGDPKVKRQVTPDYNNPNGMASEGKARNLRKVNDD